MIKKQGEVMMYAQLFLLLLLFYFQRREFVENGKSYKQHRLFDALNSLKKII